MPAVMYNRHIETYRSNEGASAVSSSPDLLPMGILEDAAECLARWWLLPTRLARERIDITCTLRPGEMVSWKLYLESLLHIRSHEEGIRLKVRRGPNTRIPDHCQWVFLSPWLRRRTGRPHGRATSILYPECLVS